MCKENENLFVHQQFIALASHVHDADAWVGFETAAKSGDEYQKAAGVEEVVVAPDFEQELIRRKRERRSIRAGSGKFIVDILYFCPPPIIFAVVIATWHYL